MLNSSRPLRGWVNNSTIFSYRELIREQEGLAPVIRLIASTSPGEEQGAGREGEAAGGRQIRRRRIQKQRCRGNEKQDDIIRYEK